MPRRPSQLLGLQSNDIDIALSDMMGQPFADAFKDFTQNEGIDSSKVGVIKKNAEQSKHLEPATLRILSHDIDFVNLRSEEYTSESRIPSTIVSSLQLSETFNAHKEIWHPIRGRVATRHHHKFTFL